MQKGIKGMYRFSSNTVYAFYPENVSYILHQDDALTPILAITKACFCRSLGAELACLSQTDFVD